MQVVYRGLQEKYDRALMRILVLSIENSRLIEIRGRLEHEWSAKYTRIEAEWQTKITQVQSEWSLKLAQYQKFESEIQSLQVVYRGLQEKYDRSLMRILVLSIENQRLIQFSGQYTGRISQLEQELKSFQLRIETYQRSETEIHQMRTRLVQDNEKLKLQYHETLTKFNDLQLRYEMIAKEKETLLITIREKNTHLSTHMTHNSEFEHLRTRLLPRYLVVVLECERLKRLEEALKRSHQ